MFLLSTIGCFEAYPKKIAPLFILLCLFFSQNVMAKKKEAVQVIATTSYISLHTGPGNSFPVFHVIEKGETITLLKRKTDWIKVRTSKNIEGWANRQDMDDTIGANGEQVSLGIPDREDFNNRRWEVGFTVGEFEDIESLGFHGGFRMTKNLTAEFRFSQATGLTSNTEFSSWGIVHQPFPSWKVSPFFTIANGKLKVSPNTNTSQSQARDNTFFMFGTGAYYYYSHKIIVRLELNSYTSLPEADKNFNNTEWKIGLSTFF